MKSEEWLGDREHALENDYFRRKDLELIEALKQRGRREQDHRDLAEQLGQASDELVTALQEAGFTSESLAVLHIVPLVEVAWADGWVDPGERALIFALAAARGVAPETPAHAQLAQWLDTEPDSQFFERVNSLLAARLALLPPKARASATEEVGAWTTKIAEATGGILGISPMSKAERECIARIAERLAPDKPDDLP